MANSPQSALKNTFQVVKNKQGKEVFLLSNGFKLSVDANPTTVDFAILASKHFSNVKELSISLGISRAHVYGIFAGASTPTDNLFTLLTYRVAQGQSTPLNRNFGNSLREIAALHQGNREEMRNHVLTQISLLDDLQLERVAQILGSLTIRRELLNSPELPKIIRALTGVPESALIRMREILECSVMELDSKQNKTLAAFANFLSAIYASD